MLPKLQRKPRKERRVEKPGARIRSAVHLAWVRKHACSVPECNSGLPIHAHHVTHNGNRGVGVKASDEWVISLCAACHSSLHRMGRVTFCEEYGLDVAKLAKEFAEASPDPKVKQAARTMSVTP